MSADLVAAADRNAIDAARAYERAVELGSGDPIAMAEHLEELRGEQRRLRRRRAAGRLNSAADVYGPPYGSK